MLLNITRSAGTLSFALTPEIDDEEPPLRTVTFSGYRVDTLAEPRLALVAYFLSRAFTGCQIRAKGFGFPIYLAAQMRRSHPHGEWFAEPINTNMRRIAENTTKYQYWRLDPLDPGQTPMDDDAVAIREHPLGYEVFTYSDVYVVDTNLPFFTAFLLDDAFAIERSILACLLSDMLGAYTIKMSGPDQLCAGRILPLLNAAGLSHA